MKKFLVAATCFFAVACSNPEDKVVSDADSLTNGYNESTTPNTNPGPTSTSPSDGARADTSSIPMGTNRPTDSTRK